MFNTINGTVYYSKWLNGYDKEKETVICLHGFTGTTGSFDFLANARAYNYLAVDLIGHGKTVCFVPPSRYQMSSVVQDLRQLVKQLGLSNFYIFGYSMGARTALSLALQEPAGLKGLILESGTPGIENKKARREREKADQLLAGKILKNPLKDFVDYWENLPLFATQKKLSTEVREKIRNERLSQNSFGLAMSLAYMGTGAQKNYWPYLSKLPPTLYIAGELDGKFAQIGQKMQTEMPQLDLQIVKDAGHCVHAEKPEIVAAIIETWLKGRNT
ncbi:MULTISPECIES: 2-succinyl-6-hydroxy-2,4-cyclohexadiene-1-carboxylate synthase [unclassified Enterococcus]|jgi:2-succinyl-6-hydroxy-2,4-cyclohexadiene-1-carboxylate synthase|uniref:2-succinyl-6-hydroxy-2, 4-cyclohexadiene-1-carboxylate synthase n=1 Tax=unclassified Enterococcus TaxID=2608891 RepID=UPI003D2C0CE9